MDVALCVCLAALVNFFDIKGTFSTAICLFSGNLLPKPTTKFNKQDIRNYMYFLLQQLPSTSNPSSSSSPSPSSQPPSRHLLNDLNRFFMAPQNVLPPDTKAYWIWAKNPEKSNAEKTEKETEATPKNIGKEHGYMGEEEDKKERTT